MNPLTPAERERRAKWLKVGGVVLMTTAVSGFFMGLLQTRSQLNLTVPLQLVTDARDLTEVPPGSVPIAVSYAKQDWLREGSNAQWRNDLAKLIQPPPPPGPLQPATDEQRAQALHQRELRRAYDGAPPVVPHPITQESSASCLACHGPGLVVKDKTASKVSHAHFSSCTQCHVPGNGPQLQPSETTLLAEFGEGNTFHGIASHGKGTRAWPGAPPTVPHPTQMRSDCMSCHGPTGLAGLRTSHPERQQCVQCHVPTQPGLPIGIFTALSSWASKEETKEGADE
ncbi:cytochrome c-type protein NapB [Roseimicrobium gellanilyticum]|uniref:Cytochrome c-type protein NapB n=1 Tax=Roseimicrobium gellanilyticum TaxID=748857 RepID=A0A366HQH5_9BACT|nr:nitrate reductase cytochrome c-type subunit [Roseimicrobium gellanilyticum]RBP45183.1 cytochrome c-type protein NapB [Roseimicrobium gellanilyticum]